jgi:hypothetical protein
LPAAADEVSAPIAQLVGVRAAASNLDRAPTTRSCPMAEGVRTPKGLIDTSVVPDETRLAADPSSTTA